MDKPTPPNVAAELFSILSRDPESIESLSIVITAKNGDTQSMSSYMTTERVCFHAAILSHAAMAVLGREFNFGKLPSSIKEEPPQ